MPRRPDMPPLRREDLDPDPIAQFAAWLAVAEREAPLPEAMTLATVDADGQPDARMVLLKGVDVEGFRFFTNYESAKGAQLESGAGAALVVYWRELDRQVRVRGTVERLGAAESDAYFATRSRDSQLGAYASSKGALSAAIRTIALDYADTGVQFNVLAPGPMRAGLFERHLASRRLGVAAVAGAGVARGARRSRARSRGPLR